MLLHLIRKCGVGKRVLVIIARSVEVGGFTIISVTAYISTFIYHGRHTHGAHSPYTVHCVCVGGGRGWGLRTFCGRCNAQIKYFIPEQSFRQVVQ